MKFIASINTRFYGVHYNQGEVVDVTEWTRKQILQFLGAGLIAPFQFTSTDLAAVVQVTGPGVSTVIDPITDQTTITTEAVPGPLDDLTDVDTSTVAPTDAQVLAWQASSSQWKPATPSGGGGGGSWLSTTWTRNYPDGVFGTYRQATGRSPVAGGTAGLWVNATALVVPSQSSTQDGSRTADKALDWSLDANSGCSHTQGIANSWWQVDFQATHTFLITRLAIVGRQDSDTQPQNFVLTGSPDGSTWTTLLTVTGSGLTDNAWWSSAVSGAAAYRYLRITQTGGSYLVLGEVEMWGTLT